MSDGIGSQKGDNMAVLGRDGIAFKIANMKRVRDKVRGVWYYAADVPDDPRDILGYVDQVIWNDKEKSLKIMKQMSVVHYEVGSWWMNNQKIKDKHVHRWTEIPDGWND